jgi:hypothetical protein
MANLEENKKYHFTYKTTNLINGRYYLGMHSTNYIDDGYIGSGKRLWYEIRKYGKNNFKLEILNYFNSREELVQAEINLITEEDLKNINCLNCKSGGEGGFTDTIRMSNQERKRRFLEKLQNDIEFRENHIERCRQRFPEGLGKYIQKGIHNHATFKGKKHTPETVEKIRQAKIGLGKGEKNSQYGTKWITNGIVNKKIKKTEIPPEGWMVGRKLK